MAIISRYEVIDKVVKGLFQAELLNEADYPSAVELQEECKDVIQKELEGYHILKGDIY